MEFTEKYLTLSQQSTENKQMDKNQPSQRSQKTTVGVTLVAQSYPTLCGPMDWNLPGFSVHGILQARILERVCHFLLQGIFPTQGSNPPFLCLLHWTKDSLPLYHLGSPRCDSLDLYKKNIYIYIYIYIERERERERGCYDKRVSEFEILGRKNSYDKSRV